MRCYKKRRPKVIQNPSRRGQDTPKAEPRARLGSREGKGRRRGVQGRGRAVEGLYLVAAREEKAKEVQSGKTQEEAVGMRLRRACRFSLLFAAARVGLVQPCRVAETPQMQRASAGAFHVRRRVLDGRQAGQRGTTSDDGSLGLLTLSKN